MIENYIDRKVKLLGLTLDEIKGVVTQLGLPTFIAKQIADWVYKKKISNIDEMLNISKQNRQKISELCEVGRNKPSLIKESIDGTKKYLFEISDKDKNIETVMIPVDIEEQKRRTLCVSSQIGCKFNCLFCMTGKQGFSGNLTTNEILNQIFSVDEVDELTNIVFMGMGEPLDNYDVLMKTLEIITSDYGMSWSPKRITVSTTGVTPNLRRFLEESSTNLAISLHNPFANERQELMPAEKAYPIKEVVALLKKYDWSKQRRLSFEYIMFKDKNDTKKHADAFFDLIKGLYVRVNLIKYHSIPNVDLKSSDNRSIEQFRDHLQNKGLATTIRASRGEDIFAACGMLSSQK